MFCPSPALAAPTCPIPQALTFRVEKEIHRDAPGFTEGLEVHDGAIWESTGDFFGESRINRIDPDTGHVTTLLNAGKQYFGEGMTFFGGHLYQMTWREHRVFVFDHDMHPWPELSNPREGWGLTHDDNELIASDGSSRLFFLSPKDFSTRRVLPVIQGGSYLENINELEYVQGRDLGQCFRGLGLGAHFARYRLRRGHGRSEPLRARMRAADRKIRGQRRQFCAQRRRL